MPKKKYVVRLSDAERQELIELTSKGSTRARRMKRAQVLLLAHRGASDPEIMAALGVSRPCVERIRQRFAAGGLTRALNDAPRPGAPPLLNEKREARLIAEVCGPAPEGHARWTLRLLAGRVVELKLAKHCSHEAVRQLLKKTNSSLGRSRSGAFRR